MKMSSSLPKIFETGINVFISNSQIITIKTYYIYKCGERKSMTIGCNIWMICLKLNWFFYGISRMLQFSQFVWTPCYSVWDVYNNFLLIDATDRSKISGDPKRFFIALSLYPFHFSRRLPLISNIFVNFLRHEKGIDHFMKSSSDVQPHFYNFFAMH